MAHIVEVSGERRLQLSNEEIVRPMAWGSSWTKLRIGIRLAWHGAQSFATYEGGIGLCVGQSGYYNTVTTAYAGYLLHSAYNWTPPCYSSSTGTPGFTTTKYGSTVTKVAFAYSLSHFISQASTNLSQFMVDVQKVGNVFTFQYRVPTLADASRYVSPYDFLRNMENENGALLYCSTLSAAAAAQAAVTVNDGFQFDTISLFHGKTIPAMEIGGIEVVRFE